MGATVRTTEPLAFPLQTRPRTQLTQKVSLLLSVSLPVPLSLPLPLSLSESVVQILSRTEGRRGPSSTSGSFPLTQTTRLEPLTRETRSLVNESATSSGSQMKHRLRLFNPTELEMI